MQTRLFHRPAPEKMFDDSVKGVADFEQRGVKGASPPRIAGPPPRHSDLAAPKALI